MCRCHVEVISDREDSLAGRGNRHGEWLKALVVTKRVGDSGKGSAVAADEAGERAVRAVGCAGDVIDAVAAIDCREYSSSGIRRVRHGRAAGIMQSFQRAVEVTPASPLPFFCAALIPTAICFYRINWPNRTSMELQSISCVFF
jgi:hypothetical protein